MSSSLLKKSAKRMAHWVVAKRFFDKDYLQETKHHLCKALKLEVEVYHQNKHSMQTKEETAEAETRIKTEQKIKRYFAHYTSVQTIHKILEDYKENQPGSLRLSDASYSNDPSEGNYLKKEIIKDYEWLKSAKKNTDGFICSFISGDKDIGDKITYWQAYGKDGLGCSIQLSPTFADYNKDGQVIQRGWGQLFNRVNYGKKSAQEVKDHFKKYLIFGQKLYYKLSETGRKFFVKEFWKSFDLIKYLYKHDGYEHEKEYRLVRISKEPQEEFVSENPYLRRYILDDDLTTEKILASGSRVVLGPKILNQTRLRKHLKRLAESKGLYGPRFISSKIPYRKVW